MGDYSAVIYFCNELDEYYSIDLNCLPLPAAESILGPITKFSSSGWTVIDECIYCIEELKKGEEHFTYTVGKNLHKYNITSSSSTWECILPNRNLRWHQPVVFAYGKKIYVVGGYQVKLDECEEENTDWTYPGEYYHLDYQTWKCMPKLEGIEDFSRYSIAREMDNNKTTIIFYSDGTFLLYDLVEDAWKQHLDVRLGVGDGLQGCYCTDVLFYVTYRRRPVVCDSTLYWFNNDLCLYGYDYLQKRWLQSNSLQELHWPLSVDRDTIYDVPLLFYLDNKTFVAISAIAGTKELALAIIAVKRESGSLNVSLKVSQNFIVETSNFEINLFHGMTIWKDEGSMLGKGGFALED